MRPSVLLAAVLLVAATVVSLLILLRGGAGSEDPRPQAPPLHVESTERDGRDANRGEAGIDTAPFLDPGRGEAVSGCLRGRVLALVDGHPVAAATIRITARSSLATSSPDSAEPAATTTSAADGRFSVAKLPLASPLTIQVTHPEFGYATLEGVSLTARSPDRDLGVLLLDLRRSLSGQVRDVAGRPIAGAELRAGGGQGAIGVVAGALPSSPLEACRTRSDGDGCYTLEGLAPGFHWVEAAHPEHATAVRGPIPVPREGPVAELDIAMSAARELRGIVVDPGGRGIPGARIVPTIIEARYLGREGAALVRPWHRHAVTDSEGRFALGPLPDLEEMELQLEVDAAGHHPQAVDGFALTETLRITLEPSQPSGPLVARGGVLDDAGGPVPDGGTIRFTLASSERYAETEVRDGCYHIAGLQPGSYEITIRVPGFRILADEIEIETSTALLDFTLTRGRVLRGVVRNRRTGEPISGARVSHLNHHEVITDAQGRFEISGFRDHPGAIIDAVAVEAAGFLELSPTVRLGEERLSPWHDFALIPIEEATRFQGEVTDPRGEPVPGALVRLRIFDPAGRWLTTRCDHAGRFLLDGLHPDVLTHGLLVQVRHPHYALLVRDIDRASLESTVTLELHPGHAVQGQVLTETGEPVAGARVIAALERGGNERLAPGPDHHALAVPAIAGTQADQDGRFRLEHLPPEPVTLVPAAEDHLWSERSPREDWRLVPGPDSRDRVLIMKRGFSIRGVVLPSEGVVAERLRIRAEGSPIAAFTDAEGRFRLRGIFRDPCTVSVANAWYRGSAEVGSTDPMPVQLPVEACGAVRGRLVDAEGRARANATVCPTPEGQPQTQTGPDGVFLLRDLPVGEVRISIQIEDRPGWRRNVQVTFGEVTEIGEVRIP